MEKLIDCNAYPANVLSSIFEAKKDGCAYYCDIEQLEKIVNEIMRLHFTAEDCVVFFSIYENNMPINKIADELQCSEQTIEYMHSRILRKLRHPRLSNRLKKFTYTFKIFRNDEKLVSAFLSDSAPTAIIENTEIKAFMVSPELYNELNQKALLVDKIEHKARQVASKSIETIKKALRLAIEQGAISAKHLQQELRVSYSQANKILAELEMLKFISDFGIEREVYITNEQYERFFAE